MLRPCSDVYDDLVRMSADAGVSCVSQYMADLMALHVGRPDLVRELSQEVLTLADTG